MNVRFAWSRWAQQLCKHSAACAYSAASASPRTSLRRRSTDTQRERRLPALLAPSAQQHDLPFFFKQRLPVPESVLAVTYSYRGGREYRNEIDKRGRGGISNHFWDRSRPDSESMKTQLGTEGETFVMNWSERGAIQQCTLKVNRNFCNEFAWEMYMKIAILISLPDPG